MTPIHPVLRDAALALGIAKHSGRQVYLLGRLSPNQFVENVVNFLVSRGYGNHFIAWVDDGEVVSLRMTDGFECQYHIRIFEDGEVRAHYEYTPECHPVKHMKAIDQSPRREYFFKLFGDKIAPA